VSRIWEALKKAEEEKGADAGAAQFDSSVQDVESGVLPEAEREFVLILRQVEGALGATGSISLGLTGPSSGVGTSTVALNLACVAAATRGKRVLLVDANLRAPGFGSGHAMADRPGFSDVLSEKISIGSAAQPADIPELYLLSAGREQKRISVLFEADRIASFLRKAKAEYQYVILDCPPVLSSAETMTLVGKCDGTIMVAEWGKTKREVAERAKDIIAEAGGRIVGITLNKRKYVIPGAIYRLL
jgi:Mrp family chromosome partitioning ATPase